MGEATDRVGWFGREVKKIIQPASGSREFALPGTDGDRSRKLALQFSLVFFITRAGVVREKSKFVLSREIFQEVKRTNIAAVLHGQKFVGLDPENSHPV